MSKINEEKMEKISNKIFDVSKSFPGKITVKQMQEPVSKEVIMSGFNCDFEAEYPIDDQEVIEKIKEIVKRSYRNNVIVILNFSDLQYELYSNSGSSYSSSSTASTTSKSNSSSGCFIATAVYGSEHANEVIILKEFRDNWLQKTPWGKMFVKIYYSLSPPIANQLTKHSTLKQITKRIIVVPVLKLAKHLQRKEN